MDTEFVKVLGMTTKVLTWGKRLNEPFQKDEKELIIFVPGNPGVVGFYNEFLDIIWKDFDSKIPVWAVGFGGMEDEPGFTTPLPDMESPEEQKYNLKGQIEHKNEFIFKYVPENVKIHLISHSIGTWICFQMLRNFKIKDKIINCYFLFPTLEKLDRSLYGWMFQYLLTPTYKFSKIINKYLYINLPEIIPRLFITMYCWINGVPDNVYQTLNKFKMSPAQMARCYRISHDSVMQMRELDLDLFRENIDLLHIYYGKWDFWVPEANYKNMKRLLPGIDARLCERGLEHGFVIDHTEQMANILCEWMRQNEKNRNK